MKTEHSLVELIIDSMVDGDLELPALVEQLCLDLQTRAFEARREPESYTSEELEFWARSEHDAGWLSAQKAHIREAYAHLGAALTQALPSDDQIIMQHVQDAKTALGQILMRRR